MTEWTIKTLKRHLEVQIKAQEKATSLALAASEKAINKAEEAQKEYNARSNEFRGALDDGQKNMISRLEADQRFDQVRALIEANYQALIAMQKTMSSQQGGDIANAASRQQHNWTIGIIVTTIVAAASILAAILKK